MKKIFIAAAALIMSATPSFAGTMDDIGDTIGDITSDLKLGAGIGTVSATGLSNSFMFYGIAEKELDIDIGDIASAVQVRLGTGSNADISTGVPGVTGSGGIDYFISGLYKGTMELDEFNVYGLAGLIHTSSSASVTVPPGVTTKTTSSSTNFTWGVGAEYELDRDLTVAVEYSKIDTTSVFAANAYFDF